MLQATNVPSLPARRKTLGKSFKNAFYTSAEEELPPSKSGLYSITLSDSIAILDHLSPQLFAWIMQGENGPKSDLRIFSPSGDLVTDSLPKHLLKSAPPPLPTTERHYVDESQFFSVNPISAAAKDSMRKQIRKPVESISKQTTTVKRFFLNVMQLELKCSVPADKVVCIVTLAKQKRTTSCLPLYKYSSKNCFADSMESFLFDVPAGQSDLIISILFYARKDCLRQAPSISSIHSKSSINFFSSLKRSGTVTQIPEFTRTRVVADPKEIGSFLGDISIVVPSEHAFGKVSSWHHINAGKKTIGRVQVEVGMFLDVEFIPMPEVPKQFAEHCDYLNFYLLTKGGLIWDKKWVQSSSEGLSVYSNEYRDSRSPIAWIPFKQVTKVNKALYEFMAAPNSLVLTLSLPWKDDVSLFQPTLLSTKWKDEVVEAGETKEFAVSIFITADSRERMERWNAFLEFHISRHHSKKR